jgi:hypothetical protein
MTPVYLIIASAPSGITIALILIVNIREVYDENR